MVVVSLACKSSGNPSKDGAAGAAGGTAGAAGGAAGGTAGAAGAAGTGDGAVGDASDARDADPSQCPAVTPVDAGAECNTLEFFGRAIVQEPFVAADGGAVSDGGVLERPMGGTLIDGDYVLVRHRASGMTQSRRTLRLLGSATRIEWAFEFSYTVDQVNRYNLNITRSGNGFDVGVTCGPNDFGTIRYDFTASGDLLVFYTIDATTGTPYNVYNYRRMCHR
jgi:hypothetical protein